MSLRASEFTVNPNKDFTRKKKWDFATLMKFIISMESQSLFESFTAEYSNSTNLFKGYRIIACDGSDINIAHNPNDKESYFTNGKVRGFNQLHLNAMYDLTDKIYTDVVIQPGRIENEHKAFCDMIDRYGGMLKTVFIVDRGYESYNNLAHVQEKGAFYLFRCKDLNSSGILSGLKHKLPSTEQFDCNISIILTRKCTKEVVTHPEIYKSFHKKDCLDYIDLEENPYYKMEFRALRFPITEDGYECIITNLPSDEFNVEEIKKLYAMRWSKMPISAF